MHEESAGTSINIGPRVLDLADLAKLHWDDFVAGLDQVYKTVSFDKLFSELELAHETWICFPEDSMAVAWDDLARLESLVDVINDVVLGPAVTVLLLETEDEVEALLVGKTMEGSGQSVHTRREGEVGVGESRSNQVRGMCRDVSTFVITKNIKKINI